jgi:hypothetical protein
MCQKQFCYRQTHIKTVCESQCTKRRERERERERDSIVGMICSVLLIFFDDLLVK